MLSLPSLNPQLKNTGWITLKMKKPPEWDQSPLEASLSKPSSGVPAWPAPEGQGCDESLLGD
jgi:hypothetical protein